MKKNAALLLLSTLALVACGGTESSTTGSTDTSKPDDGKQVEVVWWNNYQKPDKGTEEENRQNSNYKEYYYALDLIAEFETANPNIKISMEYKGSYGNIAEAIISGIDGGNLPTIASTYQDNVAKYVDNEVSYDMTEFAKVLEADKDFSQSYLSIEKGAFGGKYYSLPYSKSAETLVVNQTVFDQVGAGASGVTQKDGYTAPVAAESKTKYEIPENVYEAMDVARKMKNDYPEVFANQRNDRGFFTAVPFCWDSAENMFITMLMNAGLDYTNGSGKNAAEQYLWNTQEAKDILFQLKKWNNEGLFATQDQLPYTNEAKGYHEYSSNMAAKGTIFMCVSSTAGARYFANDGFLASLNHGLNWAAGTKAEDAKVISQGPSLTFFRNADPDVNKAAFTFYQFLTNTENSATLAEKTSYFPLRTSSYNSTAIKTAVEKANTATNESSYSEKNTDYTGQALALNETYNEGNNYFISDAFVGTNGKGSADCRITVGDLVEEVLNAKVEDTDTDAKIKAVVDTAFTNAWNKLTA